MDPRVRAAGDARDQVDGKDGPQQLIDCNDRRRPVPRDLEAHDRDGCHRRRDHRNVQVSLEPCRGGVGPFRFRRFTGTVRAVRRSFRPARRPRGPSPVGMAIPHRVILSVAAPIGAGRGTLLFLWHYPDVAAAVGPGVGKDPMPFRWSLRAMLVTARGLLMPEPVVGHRALGTAWLVLALVMFCIAVAGVMLAVGMPAARWSWSLRP